MQLVISNNSAQNPQTLDLSNYIRVSDGEGMDPANPAFTQRVFTRSLLKPGASLSLTQYTERELLFPLRLKASTSSAVAALVEQINAIIETPGATASWQDDGMTQPTYFDLLVGNFEVQYRYREQQQHGISANLRLFAQPFGRTAGPRLYAAASGIGPLLMISPYASGGALSIGASTQAGVDGFGGAPAGASTGIFYTGSPSLAGDAPARLQISYVGPLPNTATMAGLVPYAAVSLLPDANYRVLVTPAEIVGAAAENIAGITPSVVNQATGTIIGSQYVSTILPAAPGQWTGRVAFLNFPPIASSANTPPTLNWAGGHRIFAIARASATTQPATFGMYLWGNPLVQARASAAITPNMDWALYDLGTISMRPSEAPSVPVTVGLYCTASQSAIDVAAFAVLPDNSTWFFPPPALTAGQSQYGYALYQDPALGTRFAAGAFTNTLILDDVLGDQFVYWGQSQISAPSPLGSVPSAARATQFSRGLVPQPDPKSGLPIIAILGVGQNTPSDPFLAGGGGASWANPQNLRTMAQVNVLERARYVLP